MTRAAPAATRLSFGAGHFTKPGRLGTNVGTQLRRIQERAGVAVGYSGAPERFMQLVEDLYRRSGQRVAVLVDEYDKPILDALETSGIAR